MALDGICLSAVVYELKNVLIGGKIDRIHQPGRDEVVLSVRCGGENRKLLLSANPSQPRAQLTEVNRENPEKPPMFCMLLRKRLTGGKITAVEQVPNERIVNFRMEVTDELGDRGERTLVLECIGRAANLILLDGEGRITDCIRRVEGDLTTGKRAVLPGLFYRLPEPLGGVAPLVARELEFLAGRPLTREEQVEKGEQLLEQVSAGEFTPTMLIREDRPVDFSFLPILQYGPGTQLREYPDFGSLLDDFYSQREQAERVKQKGSDLIRQVTGARDRVARRLGVQEQELAATADRERLRELGDLLTTNLHRLEKGMSKARVEDYYHPSGEWVDIPLDPLKTPQQNAAKYYKEYNKAKRAEEMLTQRIAQGREELDYLNSVLESIALAEGERDLQEIRQELMGTGYLRRPSTAKERNRRVTGKPLVFTSPGGLQILVGKNNTQNDELTCKTADKRDWWFHTRQIHGSHVILRCAGTEPDEESVRMAAGLAAWYSQGRESDKVPVDYTPVKFVKKPAGARPGMVIYTTCQTILVTPRKE